MDRALVVAASILLFVVVLFVVGWTELLLLSSFLTRVDESFGAAVAWGIALFALPTVGFAAWASYRRRSDSGLAVAQRVAVAMLFGALTLFVVGAALLNV